MSPRRPPPRTAREIARRVRDLENQGTGALTPVEMLELQRLEMEWRALCPVPPDEMSMAQLDDAFRYLTAEDGHAARRSELRERAGLDPEEEFPRAQ